MKVDSRCFNEFSSRRRTPCSPRFRTAGSMLSCLHNGNASNLNRDRRLAPFANKPGRCQKRRPASAQMRLHGRLSRDAFRKHQYPALAIINRLIVVGDVQCAAPAQDPEQFLSKSNLLVRWPIMESQHNNDLIECARIERKPSALLCINNCQVRELASGDHPTCLFDGLRRWVRSDDLCLRRFCGQNGGRGSTARTHAQNALFRGLSNRFIERLLSGCVAQHGKRENIVRQLCHTKTNVID